MNNELLQSDDCLVRLAQGGNHEAYNELLKRYHHKIRQIVYFYLNDQSNVNDLVQEVLLKVFCHLSDFKQDSEFTTWLYRITQNTVKNYFRAMSVRTDSEARFANEQSLSVSNSPEYHLMNIELGEIVDLAMIQLSDELRLCYGMHLIEGQSYEDIAQKMHCPIGTVRSRIFRARKLVKGFVGNAEVPS